MGTPGPWKVYEGVDADSLRASGWLMVVHNSDAGRVIANVNAGRGPGEVRDMPGEENARLIASAPRLAVQVKILREALEKVGAIPLEEDGKDAEWERSGGDSEDALVELVRIARSALEAAKEGA